MNVSVPHSTIDYVLINAFKKELEWLKHNVELSDSCDAWSSYHSNKEQGENLHQFMQFFL